jgi:hypothetical protein
MAKGNSEGKRKVIIESMIEGRKMEAYTEHRTKEMHTCWICNTVCYKRKPVKNIGARWICIDCLRQLRETLDTLQQWEEELSLEKDMKKQLSESFED